MAKKELIKNIPVHKNKTLKDLNGERWKEIPFTEGYYQVSNLGRVKALARVIYSDAAPNGRWLKEKILSQSLSKQANKHTGDTIYELMVVFSFERTRFQYMVRRLVYEVFVQPSTGLNMTDKFVYPLDGNGLNCRADNLGLASKSELRSRELKRDRYIPPVHLIPKEFFLKQAKKGGKLKRRKVTKYTLSGKRIATYPSITKAAEKNNVSIGNIGLCVQKKQKSVNGLVYRYDEDVYLGDWSGVKKRIVQYTPEGKRVAGYKSITAAALRTNIVSSSIVRAAKFRSKLAGGFVWRYDGDSYSGEQADMLKKRKVIQYSPEGKKIKQFASVSEAAKQTSGSYEGIRLNAQGKAKSSGGFIWKWKEE